MVERTARAVIGAGFGDEGKGLMVDALVRRLGPGTVVVRANGGAQAGHTVVAPDGRRHVFHHWGAGTLAGARTHLSRFFVHDPMRFAAEAADLGDALPLVTGDPRAPVTTPYDKMVNQVAEEWRGADRHGSCGHGFGETVGRHEAGRHPLALADLQRPDLPDGLCAIRSDWLPGRLAELGVPLPAEFAALAAHDGLLDHFLADCRALADRVRPRADADLAADGGPVVFEGAQGLRLCMGLGRRPHVTRSFTGLRNVATLAREAGLGRIEAHYATRCYLTRHGAGPLPREGEGADAFAIHDPTNVEGPWQGRFRTAPLDADALRSFIEADLRQADPTGLEVTATLALTCLDQVRDAVPLVRAGTLGAVAPDALAPALERVTGLRVIAEARGPSAASLTWARDRHGRPRVAPTQAPVPARRLGARHP